MQVLLNPHANLSKTQSQIDFEKHIKSREESKDKCFRAVETLGEESWRMVELLGEHIKPALSVNHPTEGNQRATFNAQLHAVSTEKKPDFLQWMADAIAAYGASSGESSDSLCDQIKATPPSTTMQASLDKVNELADE